ncbi:unnamed protein product [Caenorhabditis angaria]|uniref:Uncharacterized protein n=1 Tax=Caenorhabditis angaria TaxID=860376 RepID=A0A9P1I823_9PELO|nr:unnamed protein product [Caenorhabditis angaria]
MANAIFSFEQILQFRGKVLTVASQDFVQETVEKYLKMLENDEVPYTSLVINRLNENIVDYAKMIEGLLNVSDFKNDNGVYCTFNFVSKTGKQIGVIISNSFFATTTQHLKF